MSPPHGTEGPQAVLPTPALGPSRTSGLRPGQSLGPYRLVEAVGIGGMGEVFRARDDRLERDVAVKVVAREPGSLPGGLGRFEHEARVAGALNHPNVVTVFDVGVHDGVPYVVFELLEGETLRQRLSREGLTVGRGLDAAVQICRGLAAAHERGVVHHDLKPENVFVTHDGRVKILDFGLASLTPVRPPNESDTSPTTPWLLGGTPGYMSPEQIRGGLSDARSDIFSVGAILFELLSGQRAFGGATSADRLSAVLSRDPPVVSSLNPSVPVSLDRVVARCLEKRPEDRFRSAWDLALALESLAIGPAAREAVARPDVAEAGARPGAWRAAAWTVASVMAVGAVFGLGLWAGRRFLDRPFPAYERLTFRRGGVASARFAPDGRTVVYAAAWDGARRLQVFTTRTDGRGNQKLELPDADLAAVSARGELLILLGRPYEAPYEAPFRRGRTLARVPLTGGAPREVLSDVVAADWSPNGEDLAVVRDLGGRRRLEYPLGHTLYETQYGLHAPRVSADGERVAVIQGGFAGDSVLVVDRQKKVSTVGSNLGSLSRALAWSADGREVWVSAQNINAKRPGGGWSPAVWALRVGGEPRMVLRLPQYVSLQDVGADGRVLLTVGSMRSEILRGTVDQERERNLSWHEGSGWMELTRDGKRLIFFEAVEEATYLRGTDGSAALRLTSGFARGLSPDGKWVVSIGDHYSGRFELIPTGAGEPVVIDGPKISVWAVYWFSDGQRLLLSGTERDRPIRAWVKDVRGGAVRPITEEGVGCWLVSPDDRTAACAKPDGPGYFVPVDGGPVRAIPGFEDGDRMIQWSQDGRALWVHTGYEVPARVYRLEIASGRRTLWREIHPQDPAGLLGSIEVQITPDGQSYAYWAWRHLNELYLVDGVR